MKTALLDESGKKLKDIKLEPSVFDITGNPAVVHQVVKAQMATSRAGTADTKRRSEVRGGGRKPWRQKGTGRARAGSIRSPLWKGGGTVFGPTPRDYAQKVPRKIKKLALRSILSSKAENGRLVVVDKFEFAKPATKEANRILGNLKLSGKVTVVVADSDDLAIQSIRNLKNALAIPVSEINPYDLSNCTSLVMTKEALDKVTEVLGA